MEKVNKDKLVEFFGQISEDELRFIGVRLVERLTGDISDVASHLQNRSTVHNVLMTAKNGDEWFSMMREIQEIVVAEAQKRRITLSNRPVIDALINS